MVGSPARQLPSRGHGPALSTVPEQVDPPTRPRGGFFPVHPCSVGPARQLAVGFHPAVAVNAEGEGGPGLAILATAAQLLQESAPHLVASLARVLAGTRSGAGLGEDADIRRKSASMEHAVMRLRMVQAARPELIRVQRFGDADGVTRLMRAWPVQGGRALRLYSRRSGCPCVNSAEHGGSLGA